MSIFSETFARIRREAGFTSAYQFFHKNGGARVFRCSFQNYLRVEKGVHLPQPGRFKLLCELLRLPLDMGERKRLTEAYLETWLGSRELVDWLVGPFAARPESAAPSDPARRALRKIVREGQQPLSLEQFKVILGSAEAYWSYRVLATSADAVPPADLARLLKMRAPAVAKALETLRRRGVVERLKDGRYRGLFRGASAVAPDFQTLPAELKDRVFDYNEAMAARRGHLLDARFCGPRVDLRGFQGYLPSLREAVWSANAYATNEKTDKSALVFVVAKAYKLFDF
jgi:DNA-binding transcriptional ArsR family regulator